MPTQKESKRYDTKRGDQKGNNIPTDPVPTDPNSLIQSVSGPHKRFVPNRSFWRRCLATRALDPARFSWAKPRCYSKRVFLWGRVAWNFWISSRSVGQKVFDRSAFFRIIWKQNLSSDAAILELALWFKLLRTHSFLPVTGRTQSFQNDRMFQQM